MAHPDYASYWRSLDEDPHTKLDSGLVKRLIVADNNKELHLAISIPNKKRLLLVRMPEDWEGDLASYPKWNGAEISVHLGEERPVRGKYLAICQAGNSPSEVFEALIEDICNALLIGGNEQRTEVVITTRLEKWRLFFQELKQDGLSEEAQQGLFAELLFMYRVLMPSIGYSRTLSGWSGPERTSRDFQIEGHAYEVKSSTAKLHHKIVISNEKQLDTEGLDFLDLIFVLLDSVEGGRHSLPALVETINGTLEGNPGLLRKFMDKLLDAGYLKVHEPNYRRTYIERSIYAFRVSEGFPRILQRDLSPGIGDISYSIILSACEKYKIPLSNTVADLLVPRDEPK